MNEALYNSQKNYVERHGGVVLRGGEEVERHLDSVHADASHIGGAILPRENATTSDVLEEVFHFQQDIRGDYSDRPDKEMGILREIDAQRYLIDVAERYNIPEDETRQTRAALAEYEKSLKGVRGDASD